MRSSILLASSCFLVFALSACGSSSGAAGPASPTDSDGGTDSSANPNPNGEDGGPSPNPSLPSDVVARFTATPDQGTGPLTVSLDACASTGPIMHYAWDFGDGTTGSGAQATHVFEKAGAPNVTLTVTSIKHSQNSFAQTIAVSVDPPPALVASATAHPRLYFDAAHVAALKTRIAQAPALSAAGHHKSYVAGVLLDPTGYEGAAQYHAGGGCQSYIGTTIDAANLVAQSRQISDCVTTLAAGAVLGDGATAQSWAADAIAAMRTMATTWPQTAPLASGFGRWDCGACSDGGSNLNNGELLYSVAVAFDLLQAQMAAADVTAIRDLLVREARFLFQASNAPATWWTVTGANNWEAVTHGGLGMAALALLGEPGVDDTETKTWIARSIDRIHHYLSTNFDGDGVNYEDSDHFGYGFNFAAQFLHALKNVTGQDELGFGGGIMQKAIRYRVQAVEANHDGIMPNDLSGPNGTTYPADLLLASDFRDGYAQWMWNHVYGDERPAANAFPFKVGGNGDQSQLMQTAFAFDTTVKEVSPEGQLPLGRVYPDFGRALFRSAWDDDKALSLSAEAGIFGSHGKPNQGHFFLNGYGSRLLVPGAATTVASDFNVALLKDAQSGVFEDQVKPSDSFVHVTSTRGSLIAPSAHYAGFDTTAAYVTKLGHARRDFLFVLPSGTQPGYTFVADDIAANEAHGFVWRAHANTGMAVTTMGQGHARAAASGGPAVDVFAIEPAAATIDTTTAIDVVAPNGNAASFGVLLVPSDATHAIPQVSPVPSGVKIGTDVLLHNAAGTSITSGDLVSDALLVFSRSGAGAAIYGGTTLAIGGTPFVTASVRANVSRDTTATGARAWVSAADAQAAKGASVDIGLHVTSAGEYALIVDDRVVGYATVAANGLATFPKIDLGATHSLEARAVAEIGDCR